MNQPYREHPREEALERFLLNMSPEEEIEVVESHVLACEFCVGQMETLETQIAATRLALQELEAEGNRKKSLERRRRWKSWFSIPKLSLGGAIATMAAGAILFSIPRDVNITAFRGTETAIVAEGRPLHLHLNAAGLLAGPVTVELADLQGSIVWKGTSAVGDDKVDVILPRLMKSGPYFLRLYSLSENGSPSDLLREFALDARWTL